LLPQLYPLADPHFKVMLVNQVLKEQLVLKVLLELTVQMVLMVQMLQHQPHHRLLMPTH
jgi:hypothetical protein